MRCFFYYSNTSFPYPILAAAMHLGIIPAMPPFNISQLKKLPREQRRTKGRPQFAGIDRFGNPVYGLWDAGEPGMVQRIIYSFLEIYRIPQQKVVFLDLNLQDNLLSLAAGAFMCYPSTAGWGVALARKILDKHYPVISSVVRRGCTHSLTKTTSYQIMLP